MLRSMGVGNGGWCRATVDGIDEPVFLRFALTDEGRLELAEMYLSGAVTSDGLRRVHLGRILGVANGPELRESIIDRLDLPGPDLRRAAHAYAATYRRPDHWVAAMLHAQVEGSGVPQAPAPRDRRDEPVRAPTARLRPPTGREHPDGFYADVARRYSALLRTSDRPAADIAEASGIPVTTVHRWVKEARRRGFLPPGRRGRAG